MSYRATNFAFGKLAAGITAGQLDLTLQSGNGAKFPAITAGDYTKLVLDDGSGGYEIVRVSAHATGADAFTLSARGEEGTTARIWPAGSIVECRPTALMMEEAALHADKTAGAHPIAAITGLQTALDSKLNAANPSTSGVITHSGNVIVSGDIDLGRALDFNSATGGVIQLNGVDLLPFGANTQEFAYRLAAGGTVNAMTGTLGVTLAAYRPGIRLSLYAPGANTSTTPTLALNGLAAVVIKKQGSAGKVALVVGDYNQFGPLQLEYDGTDFLLLNPLNGAFFGYAAGSGGSVTQPTDKLTDVTLNKLCGQITTAPGPMQAGQKFVFKLNNTMIARGDVVAVGVGGGVPASNTYRVWAGYTEINQVYIGLENISATQYSQAVEINFAVIKGALA